MRVHSGYVKYIYLLQCNIFVDNLGGTVRYSRCTSVAFWSCFISKVCTFGRNYVALIKIGHNFRKYGAIGRKCDQNNFLPQFNIT